MSDRKRAWLINGWGVKTGHLVFREAVFGKIIYCGKKSNF